MRTIITHFYNEEYLLPRWLEHHKKYFNDGVLIDYGSTDRSVEICREICPTWQVFPSGYQYFDAEDCDREVMFYERQIPGWRIALTVTEFLMAKDPVSFMPEIGARMQWLIPGIRFTKWDPDGTLDPNKPLWEQISTGVSYHTNIRAHSCRSLHNFNDINYRNADGGGVAAGRHFLYPNTDDILIFHYAHAIVGEPMLKRRLQIQTKISTHDRDAELGKHHFIDENGLNRENLEILHKELISLEETDCSDYIKRMTT